MAGVCTLERGAAASRQPLRALAGIAAIVAAVDLASKAVAELLLTGRDLPLGGALRLTLVRNDGYAWGVDLAAAAPILQVACTIAIAGLVLLVCSSLAEVDRRAPIALGLILGAGVGNLLSAVTSPDGVADFIALDRGGYETAFNVADTALVAGLALSLLIARSILRALAAERRGDATVAVAHLAATHTARRLDIELPRPVFSELPIAGHPTPLSAGDGGDPAEDRAANRSMEQPRA